LSEYDPEAHRKALALLGRLTAFAPRSAVAADDGGQRALGHISARRAAHATRALSRESTAENTVSAGSPKTTLWGTTDEAPWARGFIPRDFHQPGHSMRST